MKKTKIVCTLGPASNSKDVIQKLLSAGMNAVRINTAHGNFEDYQKIIDTVRKVADVPIIIDIKGPELRLRLKDSITVRANELIEINCQKKGSIYFSANCYRDVEKKDTILFKDGNYSAKVVDKKNDVLFLKMSKNITITNNTNATLVGKTLSIEPLSAKDKEALKFAIKTKSDYIALSYTRNLEDVNRVRKLLGTSRIGIIAKIENQEGITNFEDIIDHADGAMVARGDLGVSLPLAKVPLIQKELIKICNLKGKLVITATQMLESMITNDRPTRAEASDVANAILDGSDAVMLSGETAIGKYPVHAVKVMSNIAHDVEPAIESTLPVHRAKTTSEAITHSVATLVSNMDIDEIVCLTHSGFTAQMLSRHRLDKPIIAVTNSHEVKRHLKLYYGVHPVFLNIPKHHKITFIAQECFKKRILDKNDVVIFTAGVHTLQPYVSNLIEVHNIDDLLNYAKKV